MVFDLNFKKAQFQIQQMAFMIVFVFIFFTLVGLFFVQVYTANLRESASGFERGQVVSALLSFSELPEFSCSDRSSSCIDLDKITVLGESSYNQLYSAFWPVSSVRIYKINADYSSGEIRCPGQGCNYYEVYDSGLAWSQRQSAYISLCKTTKQGNRAFPDCEIAQLTIGLKEIGTGV